MLHTKDDSHDKYLHLLLNSMILFWFTIRKKRQREIKKNILKTMKKKNKRNQGMLEDDYSGNRGKK